MDPRKPSGNDVAASAIFKKFLGKAEAYIQQPTRLKQLLTDAYQKASEKNEVGTLAQEAWATMQTLFRLVRAAASGEYTGVPGTTIAAAVAVLIYFLSPIDLIPDFIPVLGLLDDVALVAWFSTTVKHELDRFADWEVSSAAVVPEPKSPTKATPKPAANGAYAATDKETPAPVAAAAATAAASSGNQAKHHADALDEQAEIAPDANEMTIGNKSGGTTALSAESLRPAPESAKNAGTTDLPSAPALTGQSATDAGLGSPSSSTSAPVHAAGPDATPTAGANPGDDMLNTTGSREGSRTSGLDAGGNVR